MDTKQIQDKAKSYSVLALSAVFVCVTSIYLYSYTSNILHERLRERLISMSRIAALQFDAEDILELSRLGASSVRTTNYIDTVRKLREIKLRNPEIKYIYIFGLTENSNAVKFIADADVITLDKDLNYFGDELSEDDWVGSLYDVSGLPALRDRVAFYIATTDEDLYQEEWGMVFSAYAPIKGGLNEMANAVIGIDVDVTSYQDIVNAALIPFIGFIVFLLLLLSISTFSLVSVWDSRVHLLNELDRQKDELLSIVSHQLATPVSSLKWYIEMMIDGDVGKITKAQTEHLQSMAGISTNLSDLVSMILDVSRIQLGRIKVEKQAINLKELFDEILTIIGPKAEEKGVKFDVDIPKTFPKAQLDKRYTHMVIENLLSNAVKYTPKDGTVSLNVSIKGNIMSLSVKDTGCGIPLKDQAQIFGKLFRASNVRNSVEGNGFGLFVAKGAVEAQGGSIRFESKEGKGTTFFVDLPLADSVKVKKKVK